MKNLYAMATSISKSFCNGRFMNILRFDGNSDGFAMAIPMGNSMGFPMKFPWDFPIRRTGFTPAAGGPELPQVVPGLPQGLPGVQLEFGNSLPRTSAEIIVQSAHL